MFLTLIHVVFLLTSHPISTIEIFFPLFFSNKNKKKKKVLVAPRQEENDFSAPDE